VGSSTGYARNILMAVFSGTFQLYSISLGTWRGRSIWNMLLISAPHGSPGSLIPNPGDPVDVFEVTYMVKDKNEVGPPAVGDILTVDGHLSSVMKVSSSGGFYRKNLLHVDSIKRIGSSSVRLDIEQHVRNAGSNKERDNNND
jgi:hypothetical protein